MSEGVLGNPAFQRGVGGAIGRAIIRRGLFGALGLLSGPVGWGIMGALALYDAYELYNAYNESHSEEETGTDTEECTGECSKTKQEEQEKKKQELKDESTLTGEHQDTNNWEKEGTWDDANKDFDDMQPSETKEIDTRYGWGRTGILEDGSHINVRPGHKHNPTTPTLEIQPPEGSSGKTDKFRYKDPWLGV